MLHPTEPLSQKPTESWVTWASPLIPCASLEVYGYPIMVYQLILSWLPVFVTLLHTHNVLHDVMKHWLSVIPQLDVIIGLLQNFPANPTAFGYIL